MSSGRRSREPEAWLRAVRQISEGEPIRTEQADAKSGVEEAIALLDGEAVPDVGALTVLRRGLAISPELKSGMRVTLGMALTAAAGRLIVPILVQQVLDKGLLGEGGYRPGFVLLASGLAFGIVIVVFAAARITHIRLVIAAEALLLGLRVRAFEHIHKLSHGRPHGKQAWSFGQQSHL